MVKKDLQYRSLWIVYVERVCSEDADDPKNFGFCELETTSFTQKIDHVHLKGKIYARVIQLRFRFH